MHVTDVLKNVLQTSAAVEVMNEVVLATLRSSRETCIEMREWMKRRVGLMSSYTKALTSEQLIYFIANDRPELSHEKVLWQRNEYIKICREWLEANKMIGN